MADFNIAEETKKVKEAGLEMYEEGSAELKQFIKETVQKREQAALQKQQAEIQAAQQAALEKQAERDHQLALQKQQAEALAAREQSVLQLECGGEENQQHK